LALTVSVFSVCDVIPYLTKGARGDAQILLAGVLGKPVCQLIQRALRSLHCSLQVIRGGKLAAAQSAHVADCPTLWVRLEADPDAVDLASVQQVPDALKRLVGDGRVVVRHGRQR